MKLSIHPSVGVARLGNSHGQFYLSPEITGGLPFEADESGNKKGPVINFKDASGRVRRQGQTFQVFDADGNEITLDSANVSSIRWTVHLANKKAAWYQFEEEEGNLLFGNENSYASRGVEWRNPDKVGNQERKHLIVDFGPRSISGRNRSVSFVEDNVPISYPASIPPSIVKYGTPVTTLGDLITDDKGRLIVLGGFGDAGGDLPLTSYGGSSTWHDDISDGSVYCMVIFNDLSFQQSQAWVIVGSPDFAPEIVNISTLGDTMFDVGVRSFDLVPDMYSNGGWNPSFKANFQRDILPIMHRLGQYQWVANVQPMLAFASNIFDFTDAGEGNRPNRERYFSYFRAPNGIDDPSPYQPSGDLFKTNGTGFAPLMPLNSGSNSVSNTIVVKFLALNDTQYFLLGQWAKGEFVSDPNFTAYPVHPLDEGSVGNCVGLPMCPGIEVTWSMQNLNVYSAPFEIYDRKGPDGSYYATGLSPSRDECAGGGCEPGDLTKRMACPWQADFFNCTIQYINFTNYEVNKENTPDGLKPLPPNYYSYWWPPQSPWDTLVGEFSASGQAISNSPAGQQMNYQRGINNFIQMVEYWFSLAFIRNRNPDDASFPYFTETERNNELFSYKNMPVSDISGNPDDAETTIPVFYIEEQLQTVSSRSKRAKKMADFLEERAFKAIEIAAGGLGLPRSGTKNRR